MIIKATPHHDPAQTDPIFYGNTARHVPGQSSQGRFTQWAVTLTMTGAMNERINGRELHMRRGYLSIVAPDTDIWWQVPHGANASGWEGVWAVFHPRPHWYAWLQFPETVPGCAVLRLENTLLFGAMRRLLLKATRVYRGGSPDREAWAMLILERALLALHTGRRQSIDERVQQAMEYLNTHYASSMTVEEIARACHVSVSHLSSLFQMQVGASPIEALEQVRMQRAQEMLKMSFAPINEIAAAVGYRSSSYFIQRFRRFTGQTPREFRRAASTLTP